MATQVRLSPAHRLGREEGFLHYAAREGRVILRWTMVICLAAIVLLMVSPFWMAAVLPAIVLLGAYVMLLLAGEVGRRADHEAHAMIQRDETAPTMADVIEDHAEDDQLEPDQAHLVMRESTVGVIVLGGALLLALVLAFAFLPWQMAAIGVLVVFAYVLFISAPLWLGWFNDDIEDESRRLRGEPQSARVKTE